MVIVDFLKKNKLLYIIEEIYRRERLCQIHTRQSYKQEITDNVSLAVFNCGLQSCAPNHSWGPGVRDHFLIHFVLSGKGKYVCEGKEYDLKAGDMFLIKPSQVVSYIADENDPWEYYWVGFNGTYAAKNSSQFAV